MSALPNAPTPDAGPMYSPAPTVRLLRAESAQHPFAMTVAAAWTCYGARPAKVENVLKLLDAPADPTDEVRSARRNRAVSLYDGLFEAGHHTTFQHANFVFVLDGVSRLAIWSFFHHHPHYNSEQVSQRYREVSGKVMVAPQLTPRQQAIYGAATERAVEGYRRITTLLSDDVAARYSQVFPARAKAAQGPSVKAAERMAEAVQRKSQEVARYVLPLATPAHLYHTINGLTLLRYYVLANQLDVPQEVRFIVNRMMEEVLAVDPRFLGEAGHLLDLQPMELTDTLEHQVLQEVRGTIDGQGDEAFFVEFDERLGARSSRLAGYAPDAEAILADAVRAVLGVPRAALDDTAAIAKVMDPAQNEYLGHPLFLAMNSKLMQAMNHVPFTFQKAISGAEDAQNQRHRGTLSSSPILAAHLRQHPDVIVPEDVTHSAAALEEYHATVAALWEAKNQLLDDGAPPEAALYLLPNSHKVRFYESGTLLTYYWKWVKRLCLNAQREIFDSAWEETGQVAEQFPRIGAWVSGPPCVVRSRAGATPPCPEGERYCGTPIWRNYDHRTLPLRRVL